MAVTRRHRALLAYQRSFAYRWLRTVARVLCRFQELHRTTSHYHSVRFFVRLGPFLIGQARLFVEYQARNVPGTAWLHGLYVHPLFRRMGLGRELTRRVICAARSFGIPSLHLTVTPSNIAARRLYEQLGFREVEPVGTVLDEVRRLERLTGQRELAMSLSLPDGSS